MTRIHTLKLQWLFSLLLLPALVFSQNGQSVSLLFVGDVMQHGPQIKGAYNPSTDRYEYEHTWQFIKPTIEKADLAIANLEVTHAGKPYSGYPQFSAPDDLSRALKNTGFDILLTANNHSCDGGAKGVVRTLDVLDGLKLPHTGTFRSKEERDQNYPLIVERNNLKIAILNYTYGTNGLYVKAPLIINYIDSAVLKTDFEKAKKQADYIICTMHWGDEYKSLPNAKQKSWERYCYELGADMVIGSHPHVIQPVERKTIDNKEKLTAYSLGNFVSNQRDRYKNGGMMLRSEIARENNQVVLKKADYMLFYVHTAEEGAYKHYYVLPDYPYDSLDGQFFSATERATRDQFFTDSRDLMNKHGKNIAEFKVSKNITFDRVLKGYYAIEIDSSELRYMEHQLPHMEVIYSERDLDGKSHVLIGYAESEVAARGNKQMIDLIANKPENVKIVHVSRFGIKEIK
ncbi:CapA family protein [Crocinitomicaceae bacterium CZZ-1]|uniref:CapA family protein n=1 Tax=Taishania pollutisoli TaxID=2766479 RepID=A0A8J6PDC5_9FLAO|nr:CapA family protein [Taishania pollutisoli]MBC9813092.1 CapA family protein [Taishania pollutisoli]MBX2948838.1 CapA family protein [Crocinitomicaceae bacterium]NGF75825.1 CapA family protein [Fluviicola sp. SGL-29]